MYDDVSEIWTVASYHESVTYKFWNRLIPFTFSVNPRNILQQKRNFYLLFVTNFDELNRSP